MPTLLFIVLLTFVALPGAHAAPSLEECSNASISGDYGYVESGIVQDIGVSAEVGVITADGEGNMTIQAILQTEVLGPVFGALNVYFEGTYNVQPNCFGTADLTNTITTSDGEVINSGETTAAFVLNVDDELRFVVTTPDRVLSGTGKRTLKNQKNENEQE